MYICQRLCVQLCVCMQCVYVCVGVYMWLCASVQAYCRPIMDLAGERKFNCFGVPMAQSGWVDKPFLLCILTPTIQLINFIAFAMRREWAERGVEGPGAGAEAGARMANDNRVPGIDILVNGMWINYLKTQNDMGTDSRGSYRRDIDGCGALI